MAEKEDSLAPVYPLNAVEVVFYFAIWISHSLSAFLIAARASSKIGNWFNHWLEISSYLNGLRMDNSDVEWKLFRISCPGTALFFALHSVTYRFISSVLPATDEIRSIIMITFWTFLHFYWASATCVTIIFIFATLAVTISFFTRRQIFSWIFVLLFITKISDWAPFATAPSTYYREFNLYIYSAIKVINLCIYLSQNTEVLSLNLVLDFAEYMLYPPYSMSIIVLFEDFQKQKKIRQNAMESINYERLKQLNNQVFRLLFWFLFRDVVLHLCFVNAFFNSPFTMLTQLHNYEVISISYVAGQLFHLKYVVIFGLPSLFAALDGMTPPEPPICISRVSKYSEMWRSFDRGLYNFLKKQLYIPILSQNGFSQISRRFGAVTAVFLFVLLWHGLNANYFCWVFLSILELSIERVGSELIWPSNLFQQYVLATISRANIIRLKAFSMLTTVIPGIFGIFFFLARTGTGQYVFTSVLLAGLSDILTLNIHFLNPGWVLAHLLVLGYAFNNVCLFIEQRKLLLKHPH